MLLLKTFNDILKLKKSPPIRHNKCHLQMLGIERGTQDQDGEVLRPFHSLMTLGKSFDTSTDVGFST